VEVPHQRRKWPSRQWTAEGGRSSKSRSVAKSARSVIGEPSRKAKDGEPKIRKPRLKSSPLRSLSGTYLAPLPAHLWVAKTNRWDERSSMAAVFP
jgi:hypothetical protein